MVSYSKYKIHTAQENERWDDLAYRYYGDCFKYKAIIEANPDVEISPFLPAGAQIIIPFTENSTTKDEAELPIWKQQNQ